MLFEGCIREEGKLGRRYCAKVAVEAEASPPNKVSSYRSLEYRVKHYSIESTIEYSIVRELPIENLGKVLLDC